MAAAVPDQEMPSQVKIGTAVLWILAAIIVVFAVYLFLRRESLSELTIRTYREANRSNIPSESSVEVQYAISAAIQLVIGLAAGLASLGIRRRRSVARYVGVGLATIFGVFALQSLASGGNVAYDGLRMALAVVSVTFLISRPAALWCQRTANRAGA